VTPDDHVIQLAIKRGLVSAAQVADAQAMPARRADPAQPAPGVIDQLRAEGVLSDRQLAGFLAGEFAAPLADLKGIQVSPETLRLVPRAFAFRHDVLPLAHEGQRLRVAVADPSATEGVDGLCYLTGLEIVATVAPVDELRAAMEYFYGREAARPEESDGAAEFAAIRPTGGDTADAGEPGESDAPIIALVHAIIHQGVQRGASDIHFEPLGKRFRVRYRIDGLLAEAEYPPKRLQAAMLSRLKIMANLSIAEKRLPQDGRIQVEIAGRSLDLRVSCLPTAHGESIVMRLLDKAGLKPALAELGLSHAARTTWEQLIKLPDGMLLVTGPTGSGKTTTLYSCLHHLNQSDRKIITVEDPVEYQLAGVNQVPVRPEIGMTFAAALRAMLRQAPNIVMVGEIRDRETAETAINASLTGHMVFSTLHTNDAAGAITRLIDMGVKPFLVSTSLRAVLAQRLVRKICPACIRPYRPEPAELRLLALTAEEAAGASFRKGAGCVECSGTGYRGRLGIFELLILNDEIRSLIHARAGAAQLRERVRASGLTTLREDGIQQVIAGLTTIEEVVSITVDDGG
jgi:type IV pilus assembly protein PilB